MAIELQNHTIEKLAAVVRQIDTLLLSDFPYDSTKTALEKFKDHFLGQIDRVKRAAGGNNRILLVQACMTANNRILENLPYLGFLLRSTNVRNNFECYDSLLQIAQRLIGPEANIIISSEWDMSPLTYALNVSVLPNYVLLGMPATESSNALILPLTGHELGHSVWTNENLENRWAAPVQKKVYEYIKKEKSSAKSTTDFLIVDEISKIALAQMEEVFCDAIGLIIFGESFVHAFHYLLAPGWGGERPLYYPALPTRAKFMVDHGGIDFSAIGYANFPLEFMERQPRLSSDQKAYPFPSGMINILYVMGFAARPIARSERKAA